MIAEDVAESDESEDAEGEPTADNETAADAEPEASAGECGDRRRGGRHHR